jgi:hypothetical protein
VIEHAPSLFKRNTDFKLFVATNAFFSGFSYVIYQHNHISKRNEILKFNSKATRIHEKNYGISKLKLTALVFALKSERNTLLLEQFTAFTDHNPLLDILTNIKFNPLINSFYNTLSEFIPNMAICYIKGILNVLPDMLSR